MKTIPLTKGQLATVDDIDYPELSRFCWQAKWNKATRSFRAERGDYRRGRGMRTVAMSRQIMGLSFGDAREVDHRNHDTLDNTRGNLRICTTTQNRANKRIYANNKTGFKGVRKRSDGRWQARIQKDGCPKTIGCYGDPVAAAMAYNKVAVDMFGEYALVNSFDNQ